VGKFFFIFFFFFFFFFFSFFFFLFLGPTSGYTAPSALENDQHTRSDDDVRLMWRNQFAHVEEKDFVRAEPQAQQQPGNTLTSGLICKALNGTEPVRFSSTSKKVTDLAKGLINKIYGVDAVVGGDESCLLQHKDLPNGDCELLVRPCELGKVAFTKGPAARSKEGKISLRGQALSTYLKKLEQVVWEDINADSKWTAMPGVEDGKVVYPGANNTDFPFENQRTDFKHGARLYFQPKQWSVRFHSLWEGLLCTTEGFGECHLLFGIHDSTRAMIGACIDDVGDITSTLFNVFGSTNFFPACREEWVTVLKHPVVVKLEGELVQAEFDRNGDGESAAAASALILLEGRAQLYVSESTCLVVAEKNFAEMVQKDKRRLELCKDGVVSTFLSTELHSVDTSELDRSEFELLERYVLDIQICVPDKVTGTIVTTDTQGTSNGLSELGVWLRMRGFSHPNVSLVDALRGSMSAHICFDERVRAHAELYCGRKITWDDPKKIFVGRPVVSVLPFYGKCGYVDGVSQRCLLVVPLEVPWIALKNRCDLLRANGVTVVDVIPELSLGMLTKLTPSTLKISSLFLVPHLSDAWKGGNEETLKEAKSWYLGKIPLSWELICAGYAPMTEQCALLSQDLQSRIQKHRGFLSVFTLLKPECSCGATTMLMQIAWDMKQKGYTAAFVNKAFDADDSVWLGSDVVCLDLFEGSDAVLEYGRRIVTANKRKVTVLRAASKLKEEYGSDHLEIDPFLSPADIRALVTRINGLDIDQDAQRVIQEIEKNVETLEYYDRHIFVFGLAVGSGEFRPATRFFESVHSEVGELSSVFQLLAFTALFRSPLKALPLGNEWPKVVSLAQKSLAVRSVLWFEQDIIACSFVHPMFGRMFLSTYFSGRKTLLKPKSASDLWSKVSFTLKRMMTVEKRIEFQDDVFVRRESEKSRALLWFPAFVRSFAQEENGYKRLEPILDATDLDLSVRDMVKSRVLRSIGWDMREINPHESLAVLQRSVAVAKSSLKNCSEKYEYAARHNLAICLWRTVLVEYKDTSQVNISKGSSNVIEAMEMFEVILFHALSFSFFFFFFFFFEVAVHLPGFEPFEKEKSC
jgi:hypothetical protein